MTSVIAEIAIAGLVASDILALWVLYSIHFGKQIKPDA
jgi:hypothetical protein